MVNQNNPYGSLQYTQTGVGPNGTPIYTANTNLNPVQQSLFDQLMGTKGTAGGQAGSLLSGANYGATTPDKAIGDMTSGREGQMMASYQAGNQPMQQTARQQLDTQLKNQGLNTGEPGYDNAMRSLDTSQTLANNTANANFANQAFGQASSLYGMPLQMAESLGSFGAPQTPNQDFVNAPGLNIQPASTTAGFNSASSALNDQYKNQYGQYGDMMSGLFGLGTDALGAMSSAGAFAPLLALSDRSLKRNIKHLGFIANGLPYYSFKYLWSDTPQIGLMADEVEQLHPDAVHRIGGYKAVDYGKAVK